MASPTGSAASFRTAQEGSPRGESIQAIDGVLAEPNNGIDHGNEPTSDSPYRPVRDIPYQLRDHIRVFLEEKMYGEAIQLLTSLAAAGGSDDQNLVPTATGTTTTTTTTTSGTDTPIWLPPPSHLAVLASLAIHPAYTTRPQDGTDLRVAGHAMQYLRHVLTVAGPVGAEMAAAFTYKDARGQKSSKGATAAARARARAAASSGAGRGGGFGANSGNATPISADGRAGRPRRQLRASTGRSSLRGGEYVDSQTMSWSDDEDKKGGGTYGRGRNKKKKGASRGGSRRRNENEDDYMDMGNDKDGADNGNNDGNFDDDDDFDAEDNDEEAVSGRMATRDGVWVRGQNFWRVVAWALGCSVQEPARWRCWRPWLTLMVDVLEADLAERLADDEDDLFDSLLFQYLCEDGGSVGGNSTTQLRRISAAILSDGSQPALAREVFDKETILTGAAATSSNSENNTSTYTRPKRALDLDNDKFGDYSDDDESAPSTPESSPSPSPSPFGKKKTKLAPGKTKAGNKRGSKANDANTEALDAHPGFLESLPLRRRLFYLVALGSVHFSTTFATPDAVYRSFAEVLREAEISVFASFVSAPPPPVFSLNGVSLPISPFPISSPSPDDVFVSLLRHILFTYLPTSAPKPHIVDPIAAQAPSAVAAVSSHVLERCFLPFAANTVLLSANVRMALALESLFRLVWQPSSPAGGSGDTEEIWSPTLQTAAETGVRARENRVRPSSTSAASKQKSAQALEAYGRDLLQRSGRRLLAMVQLARMDAGEPEMVVGDL